MIEQWEILDNNGDPTGEIMEKYDQKVFDRGLYHLGSDVWIINSENKILIQKRSQQKRLEPNVWAMTGGSVILEEKSKETIVREAKEELDIDINPSDAKWATWDEINILVKNGEFIKHRWEFVNKFLKDELEDY